MTKSGVSKSSIKVPNFTIGILNWQGRECISPGKLVVE